MYLKNFNQIITKEEKSTIVNCLQLIKYPEKIVDFFIDEKWCIVEVLHSAMNASVIQTKILLETQLQNYLFEFDYKRRVTFVELINNEIELYNIFKCCSTGQLTEIEFYLSTLIESQNYAFSNFANSKCTTRKFVIKILTIVKKIKTDRKEMQENYKFEKSISRSTWAFIISSIIAGVSAITSIIAICLKR